MSIVHRCDVLIAGLGPVGATLAGLLGRMGASVIVVEPELAVYPLPRAAHIDHEIMRIFQGLGLAEAIGPHVRTAPDYEFQTRDGAVLMRIERDGVVGSSGWAVSYNVYQPGIEEALRTALRGSEKVSVMMGTRFAGIESNNARGVTATILTDAIAARVEARFLVGCDGAWSPVREACGIELDDYDFDEPWLVLDARVADESGFPRMNLQICDPARPTSFVHMGPGRLRWEFMIKPDESSEAMRSDHAIAALLEPWRKCGKIEVERTAVYRFHGLAARKWRSGSVFIAGDAAHQMPPFMGQGLCSGLRDAANLAWKLSAALNGNASNALLDSYQEERGPHVRDVIERAIAMGRVVCTLDPVEAAKRDAEMLHDPKIGRPVPFPPFAQGCLLIDSPGAGTIFAQIVGGPSGHLDDYLGDGAWLIHRHGAEPTVPTTGTTVFDLEQLPSDFASPLASWLTAAGCDAVLVRPDRYVFGSGATDEVIQRYRHWQGGSGPAIVSTNPSPSARVTTFSGTSTR